MSTAIQTSVSVLEQFKSKVDARTAKIGVVGLGYVGLPLVLLFSEQKFAITGFDIDIRKIDALNSGQVLHRPHQAEDEINGARARASRRPMSTPRSPTWTPLSSASPRRSTNTASRT